MQPQNLTITLLLPLLLISFLACADKPTAPDTLTEEEIAALVDARVAEEIAKMFDAEVDTLTPQEIAEIALRSTVVLDIKKTNGKWLKAASGFVVEEGLIATAYHVIKDMTVGSTVRTIDETVAHPIGQVVAVDKPHDLAILQANIAVPALTLGDSDMVRLGEIVYVLSNPDRYIGTFSVGVISQIQPDGAGWGKGALIQMTAPVSKGSSGGPVLNSKGETVGIVLGGDVDGQNLNFAVPVNFLKALLKTIQ